jgi:DNA polymerase III delta prime subunit
MDFVEVVSGIITQFKGHRINGVEEVTEGLGRVKNVFSCDELKSLEDLLAVVYDMEDFAETSFLRREHLRRIGFARRYIYILQRMNLNAKVEFGNEMMKFISKIRPIIEPLRNQELGVSRQSHLHEESDVVGLEEDKANLVSWLTDTNSCPNLGLILISGRTGLGKTTLANEICKSRKIESHFEFRKWVSASEDPNANVLRSIWELRKWVSDSEDPNANVFRSIWKQISEDSTDDMRPTDKEMDLVAEISKNLREKRCLVVFDGARSGRVNISAGLDDGTLEFPDEGNGSRLIMTTSGYVSKSYGDEGRVLTCKLKPLKDEDAWNLFKKNVDIVQFSDSERSWLEGKIKDICGGIPSAIVVLGRFLSTKNYKQRLAVLEHAIHDGNEVSVSNSLALINSDMTFGMRRCLLYFGLFPKGYEIPVRRLLRLWLVEGLLTDRRERSSVNDPLEWDPEQTAGKYLEEFVYRGMIEIAKWRKDASPKTCRMPAGILYDICSSKAEDIFGLLHLHIHPTTPDTESSSSDHASPSPPKFGVRRVSGDIKNYSRKEYSQMQHLRSYLSFNTQNKDTPALEIGYFLREVIGHRSAFGMLKVLDLERVYKPKLPHNLGKLYLLRYLGLRWTFLDTLPHSVSELPSLEILDVKHTYISSPPNSIWKMQHLRHLCLNETRLDKPVGKHGISLIGLQTLWGLFVDKKIPVKNGLDRSTNLRKLGLTFHLDNFEELNDWIASLEQLKSLRLRSKNEKGQPSKLELKPLSGLEKLTNLYLLGNLPELQDQYFPLGIIVLTLSVSKLKEDPMPILAKLPKLSVLGLLADSYTGKKMVCPNDSFESLTILKLWMLVELETWTVEEGAMQYLEELEIRCCHKLKELPDKLNLEYIDKIILTNMEKEFEANVRAKIPEDSNIDLKPQQLRDVRCHCQDDVKQVSIHSLIY